MANKQKDDTTSVCEERVNTSVSSSSSSDSQSFVNQKKGSSKSSLFKHGSKSRLEKKRHKKWKRNKIGKEDFYNKTTEFRCWLKEKKKMEMDQLDSTQAKTMFKKFVKHWNKKKLDAKYYDNLAAWAVASPTAYCKISAPDVGEKRAREKVKAETFTPLYDQDFSTFGKRAGKKALRELQRMEGGTPPGPEEPVYAVPLPKDARDSAGCLSDGEHPGYEKVKPRLALSMLFDRTQESTGESETSEAEHSFASVRRQRPLSCHGRVQKLAKEPVAPVIPPAGTDDLTQVEMRCPFTRPPRPHTEYIGSRNAPRLRSKVRSTVSTSSTDSDASTGSYCSSVSSLSSYAPSTASEADYNSSLGSRSSLRPQPPPRSSSISKHSTKLRQVAKAVIAKQSASPIKPHTPLNERRMGFKSGITACDNVSPSPPPPPPPPPSQDPPSPGMDDSMILPPPPEFAEEILTSPTLPPPPDFVLERETDLAVEKLNSKAEKKTKYEVLKSTQDQMSVKNPCPPKILSFPAASTPQPSLHTSSKLRPGIALKPQQDSVVPEVLPSPIVITRQRLTTPAPGPKIGPSLIRTDPSSNSQKPREKRPSNESLELGVTPAKKIDLDISYSTTCV